MNDKIESKTTHHPIRSTYSVGRKVVAENGEHIIERQDRQVTVAITEVGGRLFFRGAAL